jgi:hypothetical protein
VTNDAPQDGAVYCEDCDHAIRRLDGAKGTMPAYRWLCLQAPRNMAPNFVSRSLTVEEPYYRCSVVNGDGHCRKWTPARDKFTAFEEALAGV